jgi:hypothetical protein
MSVTELHAPITLAQLILAAIYKVFITIEFEKKDNFKQTPQQEG